MTLMKALLHKLPLLLPWYFWRIQLDGWQTSYAADSAALKPRAFPNDTRDVFQQPLAMAGGYIQKPGRWAGKLSGSPMKYRGTEAKTAEDVQYEE